MAAKKSIAIDVGSLSRFEDIDCSDNGFWLFQRGWGGSPAQLNLDVTPPRSCAADLSLKVYTTTEAVEKPLSSNNFLPIPGFSIIIIPAYDILEP